MKSIIRVATVWSFFVFIAPLVLTGWPSKVFASDNGETSGESLVGLQGIAVIALPTNPDAEQNGLKRELMQKDAETKLRKAGIKVLTDREMEKRGFPYLNINVNVAKDKNPNLYSYDTKIEVYTQPIMNPEDADEHIGFALYDTVKVWSSEQTGTAPGSDLKNNVQKQVDDAVDKFIIAYLAANPKKGDKP
jgi:hypothetical protein